MFAHSNFIKKQDVYYTCYNIIGEHFVPILQDVVLDSNIMEKKFITFDFRMDYINET